MRLRLAICLLAAALGAVGCGGRRSPEEVVRAWSEALNAGDNDSAADLFANGARVVQGAAVRTLATHADAVAWNSSLPCSGQIVALERSGDAVTATFVLGNRPTSACDGPGERAAAVLTIREGRIVLWHQVPAEGSGGQDV